MKSACSIRLAVRASLLAAVSALLAGCQGAAPQGDGERYFTWVDEQGRVRQSPIRDERDAVPIETLAAQSASEGEQPAQPGGQQPEPRLTSSASSQPADQNVGPGMTPGSGTDVSSGAAVSADAKDGEYTLDNYPDGDELAKRGFVREGESGPYFTWRDAEGNLRVSHYQPDTRELTATAADRAPQWTPATVIRSDRNPETAQANPEALAVLGLAPSSIDPLTAWAQACCQDLDQSQSVAWQPDREFRVVIDQDGPSHGFVSGDSHYRLVQLPELPGRSGYGLRLRSFAMDGLYVPSMAFLDRDLRPLRVMTDLVAEYVPETWYRHGYLEIRVPVAAAADERWLLIYDRPEDRDGQTVTETKRGPKAIPHQGTGTLSLQRIDPF